MKSKQKSFYINVKVQTEDGEMSDRIKINYEKGKLFFNENISLQLITEGWIDIEDTADEVRKKQMELEKQWNRL